MVFLLASVLLPPAILAMPTNLCGCSSSGGSQLCLAPSGIQYFLLPPLAPSSPGAVKSSLFVDLWLSPFFFSFLFLVNFLKPTHTYANSHFIKHF